MALTTVRNVAIILGISAAVYFLPGGGTAAGVVSWAIFTAFAVALCWMAAMLYRRFRGDIYALGDTGRALLYGGADYPAKANETIVRFAMIETAQALERGEELLSKLESAEMELLARVAAACNIPMITSGASLTPLEKVRSAGSTSWFQAYLPGDEAATEDAEGLLARRRRRRTQTGRRARPREPALSQGRGRKRSRLHPRTGKIRRYLRE